MDEQTIKFLVTKIDKLESLINELKTEMIENRRFGERIERLEASDQRQSDRLDDLQLKMWGAFGSTIGIIIVIVTSVVVKFLLR